MTNESQLKQEIKELEERKSAKEAELNLTTCPHNSKEIQGEIIDLNTRIAKLKNNENKTSKA